jgi:hypothetical protein
MKYPHSTEEHWQQFRAVLDVKLDEFYGHLDKAYSNAEQTFRQRLAKVDGPLAKMILCCQEQATRNYDLASKQRAFCEKILVERDELMRQTIDELRQYARSSELQARAQAGEVSVLAPLFVDTAKMLLEALSLCALLATLLGHKEAKAFEAGAKEELWGAIWDPGAGVVTLLKRLHAVATRTLRTDQSAGQLLSSLAEFEQLMEQWRQVGAKIASGKDIDHALRDVFALT